MRMPDTRLRPVRARDDDTRHDVVAAGFWRCLQAILQEAKKDKKLATIVAEFVARGQIGFAR